MVDLLNSQVDLPAWLAVFIGTAIGVSFGLGFAVGRCTAYNWAAKKLDDVTDKATKRIEKIVNGHIAS